MKTIYFIEGTDNKWGEITFGIRDSFSRSVDKRVLNFLKKQGKQCTFSILYSTCSKVDEKTSKAQFLVTYS